MPTITTDKRALAEDTATPRNMLAKLAGDASLWIRRAAAVNPSTPRDAIDLLVRAGARPDLSGFAAPDPTLTTGQLQQLVDGEEWARTLAARHPAAAPQQLQRLAADPVDAIRLAAAKHPSTPLAAILPLLLDANADVRAAAAGRAPPEVRSLLARAERGEPLNADEQAMLVDGGPWGRALVAKNATTPAGTLDVLSRDSLWWVRVAVAENPGTSPATMRALLPLASPVARLRLACNANCPPDVLAQLANDEDVQVRVAVARHTGVDVDTLSRLAEDGATAVRQAVAASSHAAPAIQRLVRAGSSPDLMGFATPDPTMPPDELESLAMGGHWARQLAARHPATPSHALAALAADANFLIREAVARHPHRPVALIALLVRAGSSDDLQELVTPDPMLNAGELQRVAALGPWGRRLVARHPNSSPDTLQSLATDTDWQIRRSVALHPAADDATLLTLVHDPAADVRWSLLKRRALPDSLWPILAADALAPVRLAVASDPRTPPEVRQPLTLDLDADVRAAAATSIPT